jgi:anti-anti-sigma factor
MGPIEIVERHAGDVTILELTGRLAIDEGEMPLRDRMKALAAQGAVKVLLDLAHVVRLDSDGLGMLVAGHLTLRRQGGTMKLLHLTPRERELMKVTKLSSVLEAFDDEDAAVRSFSSGV